MVALSSPPAPGGVSAGAPLGQAGEQRGGRLVRRVLGCQTAFETSLKDGLAECGSLRLPSFHDRERIFSFGKCFPHPCRDKALFFEGGQRDEHRSQVA